MISPEFCKNEYSKADANYFLKTYGHLIHFKTEGNENIMEIGCADGTITVDILLPFCENKVNSILATDISKEMVESAIIHNPQPKVTYTTMDISTKYLKPYLIGKFEHIFSFDCFQLIAEQRQAADNLLKMLKPGGQVLITVLLYCELIEALFMLSEKEKWWKYTRFQDHFAIYYKLKQPINEFKRIFREAGFEITACDYSHRKTSIAVDDIKEYKMTSPEFCKNEYSKADASYFLKTYGHLIHFKPEGNENIMEIECADGTITVKILLPFCENKVNNILATDISKEMVENAIIHNSQPKVTYTTMDISTKCLKPSLIGRFEHIFSFDCFHLIADQRQAADNLFKMLKPGGQVLITVLLHSEIIDALFMMSNDEKWWKYTRFQDNFSIYYKLKQPINEFKRIFRDAGFEITACDYSHKQTSMAADDFKSYAQSVNLIMQDIPKHEQEDYNKDYTEALETLCKKNNEYVLKHTYIAAVLTKP